MVPWSSFVEAAPVLPCDHFGRGCREYSHCDGHACRPRDLTITDTTTPPESASTRGRVCLSLAVRTIAQQGWPSQCRHSHQKAYMEWCAAARAMRYYSVRRGEKQKQKKQKTFKNEKSEHFFTATEQERARNRGCVWKSLVHHTSQSIPTTPSRKVRTILNLSEPRRMSHIPTRGTDSQHADAQYDELIPAYWGGCCEAYIG